MKTNHFIFKSETQLGDCLLHAHFMRKVVENNPNTAFDFYLIDKHWDQVKEYTEDIPQIKLLTYSNAPKDHLRGWVGQFGIPRLPCALDGLRLAAYQALSEIKMGIESPFKCVDDLLYDHKSIQTYSTQLKKYDVLLVNSIGFSNQLKAYKEQDFIDFIKKVKEKHLTIITTKKIDGVDCTTDINLTVMGIGSLSINCKVIVGIGTGAMQCCLNVWNKDKRFLYIDNHHYFRQKNIQMIDSINSIIL